MENQDLKCPTDLSERGKEAWEAITTYLKDRELAYTGGCKAFYSPEEWEARGEQYGGGSALVVVHDGGDLMRCFNHDAACDAGWADFEGIREVLEEKGFFAEQCTGWYSAIYEA